MQQSIESDHLHMKNKMPRVAGFQLLRTARKMFASFEAMFRVTKGFRIRR
jgi:hypothetical protein